MIKAYLAILMAAFPLSTFAMETHFDYLSHLPLDPPNRKAIIQTLENMGEVDAQDAVDAEQSPNQSIGTFLANTHLDRYLPDTVSLKAGKKGIPLLCFAKNPPLSHQARCLAHLSRAKNTELEKFKILVFLSDKERASLLKSLAAAKAKNRRLNLPKLPKMTENGEVNKVLEEVLLWEEKLKEKQKRMTSSQRRLSQLKYNRYFEKIYAVKAANPKQKAENIRDFIRFFVERLP